MDTGDQAYDDVTFMLSANAKVDDDQFVLDAVDQNHVDDDQLVLDAEDQNYIDDDQFVLDAVEQNYVEEHVINDEAHVGVER